jgi:hypothetical protein
MKTAVPRYGQSGQAQQYQGMQKYEDPDKKPVKMTESLRILDETRKSKTAQDVEDEFRAIREKKLQD